MVVSPIKILEKRKFLRLLQNGRSWLYFEVLLWKYGRLRNKSHNGRVSDGRWPWTNKDQAKLHEDVLLRSAVFCRHRWNTQGSFGYESFVTSCTIKIFKRKQLYWLLTESKRAARVGYMIDGIEEAMAELIAALKVKYCTFYDQCYKFNHNCRESA